MKRFYLLGAFVVAAAGLALGNVSAASAASSGAETAGANFPNGVFDIQLDGYCNVIEVVKPGDAGPPGVQGTDVGCNGHTFVGAAGAKGVGMAWTDVDDLYISINANHTWVNYYDCSGTGIECVLDSGTWSFAVAPVRRGLPDATSAKGSLFGVGRAAAAGARQLPGPKGTTFDIHFVGYCDGMFLNVPGNAGAPGADGIRTGCASDAVIGAFDPASHVLGMWDYTVGHYFYIGSDNTWIYYYDCGGGVECFGNSGNWAFGPAAPQQNRTAISSDLQH